MLCKTALTMLLLVPLSLLPALGLAHEVTPAYLEITERQSQQFDVLWKQPVRAGKRLRIAPGLPEDCVKQNPRVRRAGNTLLESWQTVCQLRSGQVAVSGLDRTLTDVFVRIEWLDGDVSTALLRAGNTSVDLALPGAAAAAAYLWLGVEHILLGFDHLLFVAGLLLLVARAKLLVTITAFTIAHSITLGLSALAGLSLPGPPVEIVIALSLILLALEALRLQAGQRSFSARYPWAIAFAFGLIHGFGFAGALSQIGLPPGDELLALGLFNLGVELGQIVFIVLALSLTWLLLQSRLPSSRQIRVTVAYGIGIAGCFWVMERISAVVMAGA